MWHVVVAAAVVLLSRSVFGCRDDSERLGSVVARPLVRLRARLVRGDHSCARRIVTLSHARKTCARLSVMVMRVSAFLSPLSSHRHLKRKNPCQRSASRPLSFTIRGPRRRARGGARRAAATPDPINLTLAARLVCSLLVRGPAHRWLARCALDRLEAGERWDGGCECPAALLRLGRLGGGHVCAW